MTALSQALLTKYVEQIKATGNRKNGTRDMELLEQVLTELPIKVTVTRDSKRDYRLCGLGYRVTLQNINTGYKFSTGYNDSVANAHAGVTKPDINDILACLVSDRSCYLSTQNFKDFCDSFGYEEYVSVGYYPYITRNREAYRAFTGCRNISENLEILLTSDELEKLETFYEGY